MSEGAAELGPRMRRIVDNVRALVDPGFDVAWAGALPWTPLAAPLGETRVALVGTAAVHPRGDVPFRTDLEPLGDTSWRALPHALPHEELDLEASYVDERFVRHDPEVAFPRRALDRLHARGTVAAPPLHHYAFAPGIVRPFPGLATSADEVAVRARDEGVGAFVLAPT